MSENPQDNTRISNHLVEDIFDDEDVPMVMKKKKFANEEEEKKSKRMTHRKGKKRFIFYPDDKVKGYWDPFMTLVLLITCINTPV